MSTNTGSPATTKITLTYDEDGDYWLARDEKRGVTAQAPTREEALEALDEAVATRAEADESGLEIDPDDPFFSAPTFTSGHSDVSEHVDEYLTDDIYRDKVTPVLGVNEACFERACEQFEQYNDQEITPVDHLSGVLAEEQDMTHIFTFDHDDFRTLGFTAVPGDTGDR